MVNPAEGLGEGLTEDEGDGLAEGVTLGDALTEADGLGVGLGLAEGDGEGLLLTLDDGEGDNEGDLLADNPSSVNACPQEIVSLTLRISRFEPNLKAPGIPLSSKSEIPPRKLVNS